MDNKGEYENSRTDQRLVVELDLLFRNTSVISTTYTGSQNLADSVRPMYISSLLLSQHHLGEVLRNIPEPMIT
ncbi:hypothetical protein DMENIID0001_161660 [Sergentomyia squamirostris]